jgi:hypothetical protein
MFRPRCPVTTRQRDPLDAPYADRLIFRHELATISVIQKEARASDLFEEWVEQRRSGRVDCVGLGGNGCDSPGRLVRPKASRSCFKEREVGL